MARAREPEDWGRDRAVARSSEARVRTALEQHPLVSHVSDYTNEYDVPDFECRVDGRRVRLEVKSKTRNYDGEYSALWPEVPPADLLILDEISLRRLAWGEGLGYVLVDDRVRGNWRVFGPWELLLGPKRQFERRSDRGAGEFAKGKVLLDFRTAAAMDDFSVDTLVSLVRKARRALAQVEAIRIRSREDLPLVPKELERLAVAERATGPGAPAGVEVEAEAEIEVEGDPAWCGLSPPLVAKLRRHFGWEEPTEVQRLAFPPVLAGENVLVLAPTAGGKTEAALLPLLDAIRPATERRPSILAISPLKALLDDQLARYDRLAGLVGATAFAWHGDVPWDRKRSFLDDPTDILLTTPESLEIMLASPSRDEMRLLSGLQAVVVDEVHAFVGTPRGAQLSSLLERIDRFTEADLQRVGLSATVGNPDDVLSWLRGGSLRAHRVVNAHTTMQGEQLRIDTYVDLAGAVETIDSLVGRSTALVFTRSRRRAEELANGLGVPVHHSSISMEGRAQAVRRLAAGEVKSVVATSSLEMGIDLGEIDLVVHDGPPTGPGSYLQRLGRAGRRTGLRKLVFTVDSQDDLLLVLGVLVRVRRGDLERLPPRRGARLVLGQQALALAMQRYSVPAQELADSLRWAPPFTSATADIEATLEHLVSGRWLVASGGQLAPGPEAHRRFGGKRLADLAVTFDTGGKARVVDEAGHHVGDLDWARLEEDAWAEGDRSFLLKAKPWEVVSLDRAGGVIVARPAAKGAPLSWRGHALDVERETWQAVREVLQSTEVPIAVDRRGAAWLAASRAQWRHRLDEPVRVEDDVVVVDSFAGATAHRAVLHALACSGEAEGSTCTVQLSLEEAAKRARAALGALERVLDAEAERVSATLDVRHRELVPPALVVAEAREFHVDAVGLQAALALLAEAA